MEECRTVVGLKVGSTPSFYLFGGYCAAWSNQMFADGNRHIPFNRIYSTGVVWSTDSRFQLERNLKLLEWKSSFKFNSNMFLRENHPIVN